MMYDKTQLSMFLSNRTVSLIKIALEEYAKYHLYKEKFCKGLLFNIKKQTERNPNLFLTRGSIDLVQTALDEYGQRHNSVNVVCVGLNEAIKEQTGSNYPYNYTW